jgi:hypothetical protein
MTADRSNHLIIGWMLFYFKSGTDHFIFLLVFIPN